MPAQPTLCLRRSSPWILLLATTLTVSASHAADGGFGRRNEGAFAGLGLASTGTVPMKFALFATEQGRKIDVPGYARADVQIQRLFTARPDLGRGQAYSNFGMHGGYMGLDLGPLCFGAGFGFDFYTIGIPRDKEPARVEATPLVAFGVEAALGLRIGTFARLLVTLQAQIGSSQRTDSVSRMGLTTDLMIGLGSSGIVLFLSGETGSIANEDELLQLGGGQVTLGLGIGSN